MDAKRFPWLRIFAAVIVLVLGCGVGCASCTLVEPGHVGIRIERAGANRGVQDLPIVSGWVAYNPISEQIVEFPTTVQTRIWTQSPHEGQSIDESITFQSSEGVPINADVALSYHVDAAHAGRLYTRFRTTDLTQLTDGYVRNLVRDAMVERAAAFTVHDLYGVAKTRMINDALDLVRERLGRDGFVTDQLSYQGALRFPQNIIDSINRSIQANQDAQQAQNQVAIREAEARQNVAQAEGEANAQRARAQGDADSLLIRARADAQQRELMAIAQAHANATLASSLTPAVLEFRRLERWDGHLPQVQGGTPSSLITLGH